MLALGLGLGVSYCFSGAADADVTAPSITSAASVSVAENSTLSFTVITNEGATVAIGGTDAALFELASNPLSTTRVLRWASNGTQDFENPADAGGNNVYNITLTPTDAALNVGSAQNFAVTVTDITAAAPGTPSIVWTSDTATTPPVFSFTAPTDADLVVGDTVRFQRSTAADFLSSLTEYTNTVDSGEDAANALTFSSGTWADGTWYVRARTERPDAANSDWSNTETKTLAATPSGAIWDITSAPETVLSESNLLVTNPSDCTGDNYAAVSTTCAPTEKKYIEIEIVSLPDAGHSAFFVIGGGGFAFEQGNGGGAGGHDATVMHWEQTAAFSALAPGDIISWTVDGVNGNAFFAVNNVFSGSQDPTGSDHFTSHADVWWSPGSITISVLGKITAGGGAPFSYRLKADAAHQTYSPPAGYSRWS